MSHNHDAQTGTPDPAEQARKTVLRLSAWDFPWDTEKALEFALFRTYAVPSISGLLDRTGEFARRTQKRYDDTALILAEIAENGFDHPRGAAALARMNDMHGRYRIANEDMLYVLSTFVFEPIRWIDRFGWRRLTEAEKNAGFTFYAEMGRRMGIRDIPAARATFETFNRDYEARRFKRAETNARVGAVTRDLLLGFYLPRRAIPLARPAVHAMMDDPLRNAMGFPAPPAWLQRAVPAGLRLRARVLRWQPKRRRPIYQTRKRRRAYPDGYAVEKLGTFAKRTP